MYCAHGAGVVEEVSFPTSFKEGWDVDRGGARPVVMGYVPRAGRTQAELQILPFAAPESSLALPPAI